MLCNPTVSQRKFNQLCEADIAEGNARLEPLFPPFPWVCRWAEPRVGMHPKDDRRRVDGLLEDGVVLRNPTLGMLSACMTGRRWTHVLAASDFIDLLQEPVEFLGGRESEGLNEFGSGLVPAIWPGVRRLNGPGAGV